MFSDFLFSTKRRGLSTGTGAKYSFAFAVSTVALALLSAPRFETPTFAQSIINGSSDFNNRFEGFSTQLPEKIAWLDSGGAETSDATRLDLPAPTRSAKEISGLTFKIPFRFREGSDRAASTAIELFYSEDGGASWRSFAKVGSNDGKTAFLFEAPRSGEYWLALKTYFKSGESAFSETRAFRFVGADDDLNGSAALPLPGSEPSTPAGSAFALNDDVDDSEAEGDVSTSAPRTPNDGTTRSGSGGDYSTQLLALARGESNEERRPTQTSAETPAVDESQVVPHPGKIKSVSVGKDKETNELLFIARWFRPDELEEKYRGQPTTVALERADSSAGPWTSIVDGLKSEDFGYWWAPKPDELKPFYLRSVATDSDGNVWVDPLPNPVDVSAQGIRSALGKTSTPIPPAPPKINAESETNAESESKDGAATVRAKRPKTSENGEADDASKLSLIQNTASEDEEDGADSDLSDESDGADGTKKSALKAGKRRSGAASDESNAKSSRQTTVSAPRPRPNIPAPTNPNEFQLNPLFTQGLGVLFQAAQTRPADGSVAGKRSIFTPPNRAAAVAATPPAEYRSVAAARRKEEAAAKDLTSYEKNPELMEGMVFYQDENGNISRTPPADFQSGSVDFGANGSSFAGNGATQTIGTSADGTPMVLPSDNEAYDANSNSGAASLTNAMYPNAATPGNSPINGQYSNGFPANGTPANAYPANGGTAIPNGTGLNNGAGPAYQTIPQTSFERTLGTPTSSGNYSNGAYSSGPRAATRSVFPPRPNVSN